MGRREPRIMPRSLFAVALAAALTLALGMGSASAKTLKRVVVPRQTTIQFTDLPGSSGDRISGVVSLGQPPQDPDDAMNSEPLAAKAGFNNPAKCLANQTVQIRHNLTAGEGGGPITEPTVVATTKTDANGAWQAFYEASGANQLIFDTFTAEVIQRKYVKKTKKGKKKLICNYAFRTTTVFSY
jgi:hypothetical protein